MTSGVRPLAAQVALEGRGPGHATALAQFTTLAEGHTEMRTGEVESLAPWPEILGCLDNLGAVNLNVESSSTRWAVAEVSTGVVLVQHYPAWDEYTVTVAAPTGRQADKILAGVFELVPPRPAASPDSVDIHFWMEHPMMGAVSTRRAVDRLPWTRVASNYPAAIRGQLDNLISLTDAPTDGRLMVFHGEPGTGKSRFIQTLADEWASWCTIHYVVDPDRMFASALYMNSLMVEGAETDRWRLVVVEDGDEFIDINAKARSGHAIARLLNLADGLVGQGLKVMVAVSTNVPETDFAAAVVRTGRCGALVEFPRFTPDEAVEWCSEHGVDTDGFGGGATLAEMYARLRTPQPGVDQR